MSLEAGGLKWAIRRFTAVRSRSKNHGPVQLAEEDHRKMREAVARARDEGRTSSKD
jgi:hypothetical protein